jgi:hypothetical protein
MQEEINLDNMFVGSAEPLNTAIPISQSVQIDNISEAIESVSVDWDELLEDVCYKLPNGYPTIVDGKFTEADEITIINEALEERGLQSLPLPEAKPAKFTEADVDKLLSTSVIKKLSIAKRLLKANNTIILYVTGIKKADRSDILKTIATSLKQAKYVNKISTAGAVQGAYNGIPYYIVIKEHVEEKTDTDLKEGLSVVAAGVPNLEVATAENVKVVIDSLIKASTEVVGLSGSTKEKITNYLKLLKKKAVSDQKIAKLAASILNENISQGASFQVFLKANPTFRIERGQNKDELFTQVRNAAANITNLPADKWCPGDIYFIRKGSEGVIQKTINEALKQEKKEVALTMINNMFSPISGFKQKVDKKHNIVAVSLKQSSAQGGKLKSAFQQYEGTPKDYNISPEEMKFNAAKIKASIEVMRANILKGIKSEKVTKYIYDPCDLSQIKDLKILMGKLGAYKALSYVLNSIAKKGDKLDDALVGLTAYGFGIVKKGNTPINPPFLKLIANSKGLATEPQYFEPGRTLMLTNLEGGPKPPQIKIEDGPKYGGFKVLLALSLIGTEKDGEETIKYEVNFRYNGGSQLTIELGKPVHLH